MKYLPVIAVGLVAAMASRSHGAVLVDAAANPGQVAVARSGSLTTDDPAGLGSGTASHTYFVTDPERLQLDGYDVRSNGYGNGNSRESALRMHGTTELRTDLYTVEEYVDDGEEGYTVVVGVQSVVDFSGYTYLGYRRGSAADNYTIAVRESAGLLTDPAYVQVNTDNPGTGDRYRYFHIAPLGGEQVGDPIDVTLELQSNQIVATYGGTSSPAAVANGSTTSGLYLNSEVNFDITVNGTSVPLGFAGGSGTGLSGTTFTAHIGDTLGISFDLLSQMGTNVVPYYAMTPPDVGSWASAQAQGKLQGSLYLPETLTGASQGNPILPLTAPTNPGDPFILRASLDPSGTGLGFDIPVWFDPEVAIGYELQVIGGQIKQFYLPTLPEDADGFEIAVFDGTQWIDLGAYFNGDSDDVGGLGITRLLIQGIDPALGLDPLDPAAFAVGLTFENFNGLQGAPNQVQVEMIPIVVPEPASAALLAVGGCLMFRGRRRQAA